MSNFREEFVDGLGNKLGVSLYQGVALPISIGVTNSERYAPVSYVEFDIETAEIIANTLLKMVEEARNVD